MFLLFWSIQTEKAPFPLSHRSIPATRIPGTGWNSLMSITRPPFYPYSSLETLWASASPLYRCPKRHLHTTRGQWLLVTLIHAPRERPLPSPARLGGDAMVDVAPTNTAKIKNFCLQTSTSRARNILMAITALPITAFFRSADEYPAIQPSTRWIGIVGQRIRYRSAEDQ